MSVNPGKALAIIIPAHRSAHLGEALESLARQTDRRFRVYVGDDASSEPLEAVVSAFTARADIHYTRFDSNLGGSNLVAHWHRCIALSQNEPWIWLFSDDDVADPQCVAAFYEALASDRGTPIDLLRFQLDRIDGVSHRTRPWKDHPAHETTEAFLHALLTDPHRAFRAQEHLFSRRVFERCGGFVDFPRAIYSDHATWLQFSDPHGVRTLSGPRVMWRSHAAGTTSGQGGRHRAAWLAAAAAYVPWLNAFSQAHGPACATLFKRAGLQFYCRLLSRFRPRLSRDERRPAAEVVRQIFGVPTLLFYMNLQLHTLVHRLRRNR